MIENPENVDNQKFITDLCRKGQILFHLIESGIFKNWI